MPRHEMAEGHTGCTLSVSVCVQRSCPGYNIVLHDWI